MAVERKDLFGDGEVYCDYYPHKRVELRIAGFKIVIHKPYTAPRWYNDKTRVYKGARIYMSTNGTAILTPKDFANFQKAVQAGIAILNAEGYNLIKDTDFSDETVVDIADVPNLDKRDAKAGTSKTIKYDNSNSGAIITMPNGKKTIYIGRGYVYEDWNGALREENRESSYEIYMDMDDSAKIGMNKPGVLEVASDSFIYLDTRVGKRKALKIDERFSVQPVKEVIVYHNLAGTSSTKYKIDLIN